VPAPGPGPTSAGRLQAAGVAISGDDGVDGGEDVATTAASVPTASVKWDFETSPAADAGLAEESDEPDEFSHDNVARMRLRETASGTGFGGAGDDVGTGSALTPARSAAIMRLRGQYWLNNITQRPQPHFHLLKECHPFYFHGCVHWLLGLIVGCLDRPRVLSSPVTDRTQGRATWACHIRLRVCAVTNIERYALLGNYRDFVVWLMAE
jgi:hypothetical protein